MNKELKTLIAEKKLSDEQIHTALLNYLKAESSDAEQEQNDTDADTGSADDQDEEENQTGEEDAPDQEQPDIRAIIKEMLAEELQSMKKGKPAPKPKGKPKLDPVPTYKQFGEL